MPKLDGKILFVTTSPRTPAKMIPEIELLNAHFAGQPWNNATQRAYMELLREENFFQGEGNNDPAFSARDRITRAPKSLGFVTLSPAIQLTPAGHELIHARRKEDVFLRQLLKFQLPSPYHVPSTTAAAFWIKPYLELFRLIRHLGSLKFDELRIFGLQLVDYREFGQIVAKIEAFRLEKEQQQGNYKQFLTSVLDREVREIYSSDIAAGRTRTRESADASVDAFLAKKTRTMRDYADACFRYLRATGMVNISFVGKTISIVAAKVEELDYFLMNTDREPCFVNDEIQYVEYLGNAGTPTLLTDDRALLVEKIQNEFPGIATDDQQSIGQLKEILADKIEQRKEHILTEEIATIKDYQKYGEISSLFEQIFKNDESLYDIPLLLEWNTWRAMTMLDGGAVTANLKFDDFGNPMSTAQGNMPDILCDYGDFGLTVEVTMQGGQRQYEMEGEPVTRHLAKVRREINKPAYCLFVAPKINEACVAHFYALHRMNISFYGGTSTIVPLPLTVFTKMLEESHRADYIPEPKHIQRLFERSNELANSAANEVEWFKAIQQEALSWLQN